MLVGSTVGRRYLISRVLGHGGMATVFEALDLSEDRSVAIKVLYPEASHPVLEARFRREAEALALVDAPGVCRIFDSGSLGTGEPYFVMEKLDGETLRSRLNVAELSLSEAFLVLVELLAALEVTHAHGLVHRDLKPENIFIVTPRGTSPSIKLIDFGIAKRLAFDAGATDSDDSVDAPPIELTVAGRVVGTPSYLSPEQVRGLRDVDHRADLWACGVVLYEIVTGRVPFHAHTESALFLQIVTDDPTPPSETQLRKVPAGYDPLLARALQKNREDRFQSAAEFRHALMEFWLSRQVHAVARSSMLPPK